MVVTLSGSLDTNVLLRLLLNDVVDQHEAALRLLRGVSGQLAVADIAVIEIAFVLERHYSFTRLAISEAVEGLMSLREINCNRVLFEKALPLFVHSPSLSFEDCCLAMYAEINDAQPLWTFDRKLASQVPSVKLLRQ